MVGRGQKLVTPPNTTKGKPHALDDHGKYMPEAATFKAQLGHT